MFRFTIRDVLWLTALVAMSAGWWVDHARQRALFRRWALRCQILEDASGFKVERLPDGTYDVWDGPRKKPDGTWAYPNQSAPIP
jgi:hypothetical protein